MKTRVARLLGKSSESKWVIRLGGLSFQIRCLEFLQAFRRRQDELKSTRIRLPGVNFTDEQLFFLTYAQIWCSSSTIERAIQDVRFSDHTAPRYR